MNRNSFVFSLIILCGTICYGASNTVMFQTGVHLPKCRDVLVSLEEASLRFQELPGLWGIFNDILNDRDIPPSIKRTLTLALRQKDLKINQLSKQLSRDLNIKVGTSFALVPKKEFMFFDSIHEGKSLPLTLGQEFDFESPYPPGTPAIFIYYEGDAYESLSHLTHELAHIKFGLTFDKTLKKLLEQKNTNLIRRNEEGQIEINRQFYDFLTERYAFQLMYEALVTAFKYKTVEETPLLIQYVALSPNGRKYQDVISNFVIEGYKISDPNVLKLRYRPISKILLGDIN